MAIAQAEAELSRVQSWIASRQPWTRRALAFVAGAVATLGQAPFQIVPAYAAALVALVWLLDAAARGAHPIRAAMAIGFFFGLGHFGTGLYWIASAFLVDPQTWGLAPGVAAAAAMAAGMALFWMIGCGLMMPLWTKDMRRLAVFAVVLTLVEWTRGHIFTGFPWLLPGYVWTPGEPVSQIASVFGIYGLTALTLLIGASPATIADGQASAGRRFAPLVANALVLGLIWGWGTQRLAGAPHDFPGAQPVVRVTDSGLSQAEKWQRHPDQERRVLDLYLRASGAAEESRASVLIWPEGAIPLVNFFMLENQDFLNAVGAGLGDRALVTGVTRRDVHNGQLVYFNSAAVIDGVSGAPRLGQIYDKYHLVPFGEYMPLRALVDLLHISSLQEMGEPFTPGPRPTRLVIPGAPPAVVLICYESIFPGLTPRGPDRPGWIINISNDAWFGDVSKKMSLGNLQLEVSSTGPWQAYEMARYRSIEEGLPMARAASGGISAIIDAYGREIRATHRPGGYAEAQLPVSVGETTLARWGNWLLPLLIVFIGLLRLAPPEAWARGIRQ